jgi:polar amino acid transport system permease protein
MHELLSYLPKLLKGLAVTVELTLLAIILGGVLAVFIVALRGLNIRLLTWTVNGYSGFMRGTPLLAQLFLIYYGSAQLQPWLQSVGLWSVFSDPMFCAIFTFSLNTGAYQAEIFRGALNALPNGQIEAARSFGMTRLQILRVVIFPLTSRLALRPYSNEVIMMLKGSSVASVVTVYDLLGSARAIFASTYDYSVYLAVGLCYVVFVEAMRRGLRLIETKVFNL